MHKELSPAARDTGWKEMTVPFAKHYSSRCANEDTPLSDCRYAPSSARSAPICKHSAQTQQPAVRTRSKARGWQQLLGFSSRAHLSLRRHELCRKFRRIQLCQISLPLGSLELRQELLRELSIRNGQPRSHRENSIVMIAVSTRQGGHRGAALTVCISATSSTADRTADAAERTTLAACGETGDGSASF